MQSQKQLPKGPNDQTMENKPKQEKQKQTNSWVNFFKSCNCGSSNEGTDELQDFAAYQAMTDEVKKDKHSHNHDSDCCGLSSGGDTHHHHSDQNHHNHHHDGDSHHDHGSADHGMDSHDGGGHDWGGGDYDGGGDFDHGW